MNVYMQVSLLYKETKVANYNVCSNQLYFINLTHFDFSVLES